MALQANTDHKLPFRRLWTVQVASWMEVWDRWDDKSFWVGDDGAVSATLADAAAADAAMEGR